MTSFTSNTLLIRIQQMLLVYIGLQNAYNGRQNKQKECAPPFGMAWMWILCRGIPNSTFKESRSQWLEYNSKLKKN